MIVKKSTTDHMSTLVYAFNLFRAYEGQYLIVKLLSCSTKINISEVN